MNFVLFLFLGSTLISQSFMDATSILILFISLGKIFKGKVSAIKLPTIFFSYFWEFFFIAWLITVAIGLRASPQFLKNFFEWKWILNLYSLFWFLQQIPWLNIVKSSTTKTDQPNLSSLKETLHNFRPFFIIMLSCFLYGLISLIFDFDLFKQSPLTHGRRFGGPFDDPMNFAHIYGMYSGLLAAFFIHSLNTNNSFFPNLKDFKHFYKVTLLPRPHSETLMLLTWILTSISILLSLTRGAWIGVTFAFIISAFIYHKKLGLSILGALTSLFVILMALWSSFRERVLQAFNPESSYDSERIVLWKSNWAMFLDHPWFGVGHGDYKQFLPIYFEKLNFPSDHFQSHAHNQYLQALSNTGLLGFLFYMFFILTLLYLTYCYYRKTHNPLFLGSLAAQISFHLGAFTECNFERSKVRLVYLFFCALSLTLIAKYNEHINLMTTNKEKPA